MYAHTKNFGWMWVELVDLQQAVSGAFVCKQQILIRGWFRVQEVMYEKIFNFLVEIMLKIEKMSELFFVIFVSS